MKKEFDFAGCLENGRQGEIDVINKLNEMFGDEYIIRYVGDNKYFQENDIDVLMRHKKKYDGICIEIKTDYTHHPNIFAEFISSNELGTPGCWVKTKSDIIIYYFKNDKIAYVIPTCQGKRLMNLKNWREGRAYDIVKTKKGQARKTSVGKLIPIDELLEYINLDGTIFDKIIRF